MSDAVVSLRSLLPAASVAKNTMTLYTFFTVSIAMMIAFALFYVNDGLFAILTNFGKLQQPVFLYAVAYFPLADYVGGFANISPEMVWSKDAELRNQCMHPFCMIFTACMMIYVKGDQVGLWEAILCEVLSRQLSNLICTFLTVYYYIMNDASDDLFHSVSGVGKLIKKIVFDYMVFVFVNLIINLTSTTILFVVTIPVSLSFLNLSEGEKIGIYGIALPIVRNRLSFLLDSLIDMAQKDQSFNPQAASELRNSLRAVIALYFSTSPVFCMLFLSIDPLSFAITYIPHAINSKLMWAKNIPQVKALFAKITSSSRGFICSGRQRVLVPQVNQADETTIDNILNEDDGSRIKEEERRKKEQEKINISNSAATQEMADLMGSKVAIILMAMRLCLLCFFQNDSSNHAISFDQFTVLFINVFLIILPIDQISAIFGFALLAQSGLPVDANFYQEINTWNTIRTWGSGYRFKALGYLSHMVCTILAICCAIAIGTNGPLF